MLSRRWELQRTRTTPSPLQPPDPHPPNPGLAQPPGGAVPGHPHQNGTAATAPRASRRQLRFQPRLPRTVPPLLPQTAPEHQPWHAPRFHRRRQILLPARAPGLACLRSDLHALPWLCCQQLLPLSCQGHRTAKLQPTTTAQPAPADPTPQTPATGLDPDGGSATNSSALGSKQASES